MTQEFYIISGIILGLLFTGLTGFSPGGIIVPGYLALFINRPLELLLTAAAAAAVMLAVKLASKLFFIFGRRRYVLCLLLGVLLKLGIEYCANRWFPALSVPGSVNGIQLIGWLIPGIIANDMYKQGILRTLLGAAAVSAMVYLAAQGFGFGR